mmetsp:Transcript_6342/g.24488  ORF Transcript_6342/g.24488 Transcript_6342/m.24488 type:complete len:338 (-) Transcript_6342:281-1294(-)
MGAEIPRRRVWAEWAKRRRAVIHRPVVPRGWPVRCPQTRHRTRTSALLPHRQRRQVRRGERLVHARCVNAVRPRRARIRRVGRQGRSAGAPRAMRAAPRRRRVHRSRSKRIAQGARARDQRDVRARGADGGARREGERREGRFARRRLDEKRRRLDKKRRGRDEKRRRRRTRIARERRVATDADPVRRRRQTLGRQQRRVQVARQGPRHGSGASAAGGPVRVDLVAAVARAPSEAALRRRAQGGSRRGGSKRSGAGDRTRVPQGRGFESRRERRGERAKSEGGQGARASASAGEGGVWHDGDSGQEIVQAGDRRAVPRARARSPRGRRGGRRERRRG